MADKPDLQNEIDGIGIEVTRAIREGEAELDSVMSNFRRRGLSYNDIKNDPKTKSKKFNGTIYGRKNGHLYGYHYGI